MQRSVAAPRAGAPGTHEVGGEGQQKKNNGMAVVGVGEGQEIEDGRQTVRV